MVLQRLRAYVTANWLQLSLLALLFASLGSLLVWQLGALTPGYADTELNTHVASTTFKGIYDNPLNAPFTLVNHALLYLNQQSLFLGRTIAVGLSFITLVTFYFLIRNWHGTRTAVYATILFGTSALFLHTARLGTPMVLSYLLFLVMAAGFWLKQQQSRWAIFFVCFIAALLLYIPGMIIFLAVGAVWQWRVLDATFKKHLGIVTIGAGLFTAAIAPLAWALYRNHALIKEWIGLPATGLPELMVILKNAALVPVNVLLHNKADPVSWLGTAPVLDVFTIVMLLIGVITYFRSIALRRTQSLIAFFILMVGLIALGGPITIVVLLPFIYVMVAGGIYHSLQEWLSVFPRNPVARWFGIGLVSIAVLFAATYHLRHYFVAWPQARATSESFTVQKP
jgi:hypothetical protein